MFLILKLIRLPDFWFVFIDLIVKWIKNKDSIISHWKYVHVLLKNSQIVSIIFCLLKLFFVFKTKSRFNNNLLFLKFLCFIWSRDKNSIPTKSLSFMFFFKFTFAVLHLKTRRFALCYICIQVTHNKMMMYCIKIGK